MKLPLSAIALIIAFSGPTFAQDAKSIAEQGNQKWIEAYNAGDAAALTALYSKDAALLPQGVAEPLIGQAIIRKFFDDAVKQRVAKLSLPVTEAKMAGPDTLFDAGTWSGDVPAANGNAAAHVSGTYLNIWLREGPNWRLEADT
jgi:uncharacterized protein (TIGR02246 family)